MGNPFEPVKFYLINGPKWAHVITHARVGPIILGPKSHMVNVYFFILFFFFFSKPVITMSVNKIIKQQYDSYQTSNSYTNRGTIDDEVNINILK